MLGLLFLHTQGMPYKHLPLEILGALDSHKSQAAAIPQVVFYIFFLMPMICIRILFFASHISFCLLHLSWQYIELGIFVIQFDMFKDGVCVCYAVVSQDLFCAQPRAHLLTFCIPLIPLKSQREQSISGGSLNFIIQR